MLLQEARRMRAVWHDPCEDCLGLLLRASTEILLEDEPSLARDAGEAGREMQEKNGHLLEGLFADISIAADDYTQHRNTEIKSSDYVKDSLLELLRSGGYSLYQLFLTVAAQAATHTGSVSELAARLGELGAVHLLVRATGSTDPIRNSVDNLLIARSIGWLIEGRANYYANSQNLGSDENPAYADPRPEEGFGPHQAVVDRVHDALETIVNSAYPIDVMVEIGHRLTSRRAVDLTSVSPSQTKLWSLLPPQYRIQAEIVERDDPISARSLFDETLAIDPCDVRSLRALINIAQLAGDQELLAQSSDRLFHLVDQRVERELRTRRRTPNERIPLWIRRIGLRRRL